MPPAPRTPLAPVALIEVFRFSFASVIAAALLASAGAASAAEIKLLEQCVCRHSRVQLGDVAVIRAADEQTAEDLRRIDLCSAPRSGRPRTIDVREIRELLALYGFEMSQLRFEGERQVVVYAPDSVAAPVSQDPRLYDRSQEQRSRNLVSQILRDYLDQQQQAYWQVDADLSRGDLELLAGGAQVIRVGGGQAPWIGRQRFELLLQTAQGEATLPVTATVHRPQTVLVAARTLERGGLISAADVIVQPADDKHSSSETALEVDDLIGMEATRTISAGQTLDQKMVKRPVLVQRGKLVTVVAIAAGVKVTSEARALDDGARGDLIRMQPIDGSEKYTARVVGYNQVEVYAQGPTASPSPAAKSDQGSAQRPLPIQRHAAPAALPGPFSRIIQTQ